MEWSLIFLGGFLGASHCVGMCGAFAVSIGVGATAIRQNVQRQALYTLGRVFTYSFGGAIAGVAGMKLQHLALSAFNAQSLLAVVAGILLIGQGLHSAGVFARFRPRSAATGFCPARGLFASFLTAPGLLNAFFAGILTGFLPCGLVYAYLVLAAGTGSLWQGIAIMAVFGTGTAPLMILTGVGASLLSVATRVRLLRLAAICVVLTGLITVGRGVGWARQTTENNVPSCPFCAGEKPLSGQTP